MITNNGKELIAKYLLGQAPSYASHIAIGCGPRPAINLPRAITYKTKIDDVVTLTSIRHGYRIGDIVKVDGTTQCDGIYKISDVGMDTFSFVSGATVTNGETPTGTAQIYLADKTTMDFEMIRIPISSRGYVNEDGVTKIAFAAELPTTERFLITEAGLWSAGSNISAMNADSKMLYSFAQTEGWKYHYGNTVAEIPFKAKLSAANSPDIDQFGQKVLSTTSDTPVMTSTIRSRRYETGRCLTNNIMLRGDSSMINSSDANTRNGTLSLDEVYSNEHIHIDTASVDFSKNNPQDELKLAFSVVSREEANAIAPLITRVYIEFLHSESDTTAGYARVYGEVWDHDITGNRYVVLTKKMSEFDVSTNFSWSKVRVIRIFASCYDIGGLTDQHYVSLDAMRFDNVSHINPLYAMTGYSLVTEGYENDPLPIYKIQNTSNYIEFRESVEVV